MLLEPPPEPQAASARLSTSGGDTAGTVELFANLRKISLAEAKARVWANYLALFGTA